MTQKQAIESFLSGKPLLVVEYRSSKAERIKWRDKESRAVMEAPLLRFSCEAADGTAYVINQRVPDTFDETKYVPPFAKGARVILEFVSMTIERGIVHFQGSISELEPEIKDRKTI